MAEIKREIIRDTSVEYIKSYIGTPYRWEGNDPLVGFDCSGLVIEFLKSAGIVPLKYDNTAQGIFNTFKDYKIYIPSVGCLVFYHSEGDVHNIIHVEIMINPYQSLGASGGGSKTKTLEDAIAQDAYAKVRTPARHGNIAGYVDPFMSIDNG
jgi:cell wall-associated NlpC family hydrolase